MIERPKCSACALQSGAWYDVRIARTLSANVGATPTPLGITVGRWKVRTDGEWAQFKRMLSRVHPKCNEQIELALRAMNELPLPTFEYAIQARHGARSKLRERVRVREEFFQGRTVWEGEVLVFNLFDHPTAKTCYAWSVDQRVTAVLAEGPVDSPRAAVQAAIAGEHEKGAQP